MNATDHDLLMRIDERVYNMHKSLFGNGQPGELALHDERITFLERSRERVIGAAWLGIKAFGAIAATVGTIAGALKILSLWRVI